MDKDLSNYLRDNAVLVEHALIERRKLIEAADAIERLEAEVALVTNERSRMIDRYERLEAENARLREEIMQIEVDAREHYNEWMEHGCEPVEAAEFAFDLGQYARAALEKHHD